MIGSSGVADFSQKLLRLKQALGLAEDQQVADALGLSKAAFSDRKRRGVFPDGKLFELVSRRPDLKIDPAYVLHGERPPAAAASAIAEAVAAKRSEFAPPMDVALLAACIQLVVDGAKARGLELDWAALGVVAGGVYEMSLASGAANPRLVAPLLDAYLVGQKR